MRIDKPSPTPVKNVRSGEEDQNHSGEYQDYWIVYVHLGCPIPREIKPHK